MFDWVLNTRLILLPCKNKSTYLQNKSTEWLPHDGNISLEQDVGPSSIQNQSFMVQISNLKIATKYQYNLVEISTVSNAVGLEMV